MKRRNFLATCAAIPGLRLIMQAQQPPSGIMTPVLTRSYTNARDCANLNEKVLTVASVKQRGLRQLFALPMEGDARGCEAQPLILPKVLCSDGVEHDLLIACSMNGLVYAFDCNDSAIVWVRKVGYPINGSKAIDMWGVNDHFGIMSTPVIDPDTNRLYLVAWLSADGTAANGVHHVITIDLKSGDILRNVSLANLTYDPGNGLPVQRWNAAMRKQRSSLLMTNVAGVKTIFFASGSVLETSKGASGWIVAYSPTKNTVTATFAMTSRYYGGGVWMAGQGLAADSQGFIYGVSGNGSFDGVTDFSECCFKLKYIPPTGSSTQGKLQMSDWWSPYSDSGRVGQDPTAPTINYQTANAMAEKLSGVSAPSEAAEGKPVNAMGAMDMRDHKITGSMAWSDEDLGSSGAVVIEKYGAVLFSGKDGVAYVANMDNMGKTMPSDFANPANNYAKLKSSPQWFTYAPTDQKGNILNAAPQNSADLDLPIVNNLTHHQHGTPAVYSDGKTTYTYTMGENGNLRAFSLDSGGKLTYLACSAEYASWRQNGMPGGMLCVSANGTTAGTALVWVCIPEGNANQTITQGALYCYSATSFGKYANGSGSMPLLWKSPNFVFNKFCPPVCSSGKVFVATYSDEVLCFGLS